MAVTRRLQQLKAVFHVLSRDRLRPITGYDIVLTIGGDGTFLDTAHYLKAGLMLGINSMPKQSVGFFCRATTETFSEKIDDFLSGRYRVRILHRLSVEVDGRLTAPLSLNDVLFANINPAGTTRYALEVGRISEEHKSSGLWIAPAPGSTAAIRSAGGRVLPLGSKKIQYVVREPYTPPGRAYRLTRGVLNDPATIRITPLMDDAALFMDGPHAVYRVRRSSRIAIRNAHRPIRAVW